MGCIVYFALVYEHVSEAVVSISKNIANISKVKVPYYSFNVRRRQWVCLYNA